jgi:hypothetical protein
MFNLIMRSVEWDTGRESISVGRLFEYTDEHIVAQFRQGGSLLLDQLMRLPCLFMREGMGDEIAYVGQINRARVVGNELSFEYTLVPRFILKQRI